MHTDWPEPLSPRFGLYIFRRDFKPSAMMRDQTTGPMAPWVHGLSATTPTPSSRRGIT